MTENFALEDNQFTGRVPSEVNFFLVDTNISCCQFDRTFFFF